MHATGKTQLMPTREGISEPSGDGDRALGVRRIDEHVDVDHRAQFRTWIDAVRQSRTLEKNDRNAYEAESRQQLIDAFVAGNGGAAMPARQSDKRPPDVVWDRVWSFPRKSRNHWLNQWGDTVMLGLVGQCAPELGTLDFMTLQKSLFSRFARDAAIARSAVGQQRANQTIGVGAFLVGTYHPAQHPRLPYAAGLRAQDTLGSSAYAP